MSGCYGSFLFTFSLPLLWQLGIRAKTIASLGFKKESIRPSLFAGSVAGITLGLLGGIAMKGLGISGRSFSNLHKLSLSLGSFEIAFPLQDEVGYRLLGMSHSFEGLLVYLLFSIFSSLSQLYEHHVEVLKRLLHLFQIIHFPFL